MRKSDSIEQIIRFISAERLSTYDNATNSRDPREAIEHYIYNTKLSENFYFLLQNLEVALRNVIFRAFTDCSIGPFFYLYETDLRNRYKQKKEFHSRECWKMLCAARHQLTKRSELVNDGKLIAELNFGFWSKLLNSKHPKYRQMWL